MSPNAPASFMKQSRAWAGIYQISKQSFTMASRGYPRSYPRGLAIRGIEQVDALPDLKVFHAGTKLVDGQWATNGEAMPPSWTNFLYFRNGVLE